MVVYTNLSKLCVIPSMPSAQNQSFIWALETKINHFLRIYDPVGDRRHKPESWLVQACLVTNKITSTSIWFIFNKKNKANQALHIKTSSVSILHAHRRYHVQCEIVRIKLELALSFPLVRNTTTKRHILIATCNEKYLLILHLLYLLVFKFRTTSLGRIFSGDFSFFGVSMPQQIFKSEFGSPMQHKWPISVHVWTRFLGCTSQSSSSWVSPVSGTSQ